MWDTHIKILLPALYFIFQKRLYILFSFLIFCSLVCKRNISNSFVFIRIIRKSKRNIIVMSKVMCVVTCNTVFLSFCMTVSLFQINHTCCHSLYLTFITAPLYQHPWFYYAALYSSIFWWFLDVFQSWT